jgi:hypothetical protein
MNHFKIHEGGPRQQILPVDYATVHGFHELTVRSTEGSERFEVFTAVTMKNVVFWDVTPCGSCKNRRFEGT